MSLSTRCQLVSASCLPSRLSLLQCVLQTIPLPLANKTHGRREQRVCRSPQDWSWQLRGAMIQVHTPNSPPPHPNRTSFSRLENAIIKTVCQNGSTRLVPQEHGSGPAHIYFPLEETCFEASPGQPPRRKGISQGGLGASPH